MATITRRNLIFFLLTLLSGFLLLGNLVYVLYWPYVQQESAVSKINSLNGGDCLLWREEKYEWLNNILDYSGLPPVQSIPHVIFDKCDLSKADISNLKFLIDLNTIQISNSKIEKGSFNELPKLNLLVDIMFENTVINKKDVLRLNKWRNLVDVHLRESTIDDECISVFADMPHLESLNISYTQISDKSLPYLIKLHQLDELNIIETKISENGFNILKQKLPKTSVISEYNITEW